MAQGSLDQKIQEYFREFEEECRKRMAMGAEQYGPTEFLNRNVLQMAMEELCDMANYAKMKYAKLSLLEEALQENGFLSE